MHTVRIRRLHAQYRLPGRAARARARLDAILATGVGEAVESALDRLPLDPREELCIRRLSVPVQLRLAASDLVLARDWAEAVVTAIDEARRHPRGGGAPGAGGVPSAEALEVVRYPSRQVAFLEVSQRNARGDRRRAWAWRQLDLWRAGDQVTEVEAVREWVRTLVREPRFVVSTLRRLATAGDLEWYARRLEEKHWLSLAAGACEVNGVALTWKEIGGSPEGTAFGADGEDGRRSRVSSEGGDEVATATGGPGLAARESAGLDVEWTEVKMRTLAEQVIRGSPLARVWVWVARDPAVLRSVATLMLLDWDPGWSGRPRALWLQALTALERAGLKAPATIVPWPERPSREAGPRPVAREDSPEAPSPSASLLEGKAEEVDSRVDSITDGGVEGRLRAETSAGGLLYVLNLLPVVGWPSRVDRDFPGRSVRWVHHQLGSRLLARAEADCRDDDPALLAFAGLPPGGPVPESEGEFGTGEAEGLDRLAEEIEQTLRDRFALLEPLTLAAGVLGWVCRRSAVVVADPGWIEVRFRLSSVSTDLRRMGLDLDPGFVPWLGVVVRFAYE